MAEGKFTIPNGYVTTIIGVMLTAAIGFNAWAVAAVYDRPTEEKVIELIKVHSPYVADRKAVLDSLQRIEVTLQQMQKTSAANTAAVIELKALISKAP